MSQKQVMPKSEDLSRSLEINAIWTFDPEFPTIFNTSCTYITFKSAVKHRQLGYGYPRGQTVQLAEATTQDTYSIADDITVHGNDEVEHAPNFHMLMKRAQEKGLGFNKDKCQIKQKEVPFFGNIYSESGVRPNPSKVQAIKDLTVPTNVNGLQQFLGMITYLAPYICNLSEHTAPLCKLLQKNVEFQWHHEHDSAFTTLKGMI